MGIVNQHTEVSVAIDAFQSAGNRGQVLEPIANLRQVAPQPEPEALPRRTVGQLVRETEEHREREHRRRVAEAEAKRIRELKALAKRESETWTEIFALIEQMQAKPYAEAVRLLGKLRDLAEYQGEEEAFQQRLNGVYEQYSRRSALLRRLREAGLHQL